VSWKVKFRLFQASTYSIVFFAIIFVCFLTGKWFEACVVFVGFVLLRYTFEKTYHSDSFWRCIALTIAILVFAILLTPSKNTTILCGVLVGLLIDYFAYLAKDYSDVKKELYGAFFTDNCTEEELLKRCDRLKFSTESKMLCVELFIKKTKHSELAKMLCVDEASIRIRKYRLKEKLNKNLKN
jgi:hypothetical protein